MAPVPRMRDLLRAAIRRPADEPCLVAPWCRDGETGELLTRSAWSLAAIALWRRNVSTKSLTIWFPAYFCDSALDPVRGVGASVVFYPIRRDSEPEVQAWAQLAQDFPPDVVVMVHYMGRPSSSSAEFARLCAESGAWLVEDAAHVLRPTSGVGSVGDFVLYSPHKHLPVPDGAILVRRPNGPSSRRAGAVPMGELPPAWKTLETHYARRSKSRTVEHGVWLAKRLLQRFGVRRSLSVSEIVESPTRIQPAELAPALSWSASSLPRRLLSSSRKQLGRVARLSRRNARLWESAIAVAADEGVITFENPREAEVWTPYQASVICTERAARKRFSAWRAQGIPVSTWPDLPPEVIRAPEAHAAAWYLQRTKLFLPVHESIQAQDILRAIARPAREVADAPDVRLEWEASGETAWDGWLKNVGASNLLQAWYYGEAKVAASRWKVRRGVFKVNAEPIAVVQVLTRRLGPLQVNRVNRGPLNLRSLSNTEQLGVLREIGRLGNALGGSILLIAPELKLTGANALALETLGFRLRHWRTCESVRLDLRRPAAELLAGFSGSWRSLAKDISRPERRGVTIAVETDQVAHTWMTARHEELMRERRFDGVPPDLLRHVCSAGREQVLVVRAVRDGEAIAGACIAIHGVAATYLSGWSSGSGRKMGAMQMVLWAVVDILRDRKAEWFDLGGIDDDLTPGISAFKRGMGGQPYELVGEYFKW